MIKLVTIKTSIIFFLSYNARCACVLLGIGKIHVKIGMLCLYYRPHFAAFCTKSVGKISNELKFIKIVFSFHSLKFVYARYVLPNVTNMYENLRNSLILQKLPKSY